ncbi:MAG: CinA family protein [Acidimicrobiia bacterium]
MADLQHPGTDATTSPAPGRGAVNAATVEQIVALLGHRQLATAESCTGGRLAAAFAAAAAASRWYRGGVVPYQEDLKRRLLGVAASSVYCEQAVAEMAVGAARLLDADVAIATSGVAGEPVDGTAPGTVYIATMADDVAGGMPWARTYRFDGEADEVCDAAVAAALRQVHEHLTGAAGGAP